VLWHCLGRRLNTGLRRCQFVNRDFDARDREAVKLLEPIAGPYATRDATRATQALNAPGSGEHSWCALTEG
jgi:hypothetical protein